MSLSKSDDKMKRSKRQGGVSDDHGRVSSVESREEIKLNDSRVEVSGIEGVQGRGADSTSASRTAVEESGVQTVIIAKSNIQGSKIVASFWLVWLTLIVSAILHWKLYASSELLKSVVVGMIIGFAGTAMYYQNQKWKDERNQRLGMIPGKKGTQFLLHNIPLWLSFSDVEKMEWLNSIIRQAWPFYDKAICDEIKHQVEPMLDEYRPSFIRKISFQKLTFGDSPFRIEAIQVPDKGDSESIEIDVGFRWSGDASIFLAIELMAGGSATRMVPKVTDLAVSGEAKIVLSPLLPEIPGFGAATVSLMTPPLVKFHLDFGAAFGGSLSAKAVKAWLDPFLRETFTSMLVWPRRIVVPILPEEKTGPLLDLYMRNKGAIEVFVKSGNGLPRMDKFGSADPFLELFVDPNGDRETTSKKANTLNPIWEETHWLLVQEPEDQFLHLKMFDVDMVNMKELFRVNLVKGAASVVGSADLIGRAKVSLADISANPGRKITIKAPLGEEEFSNPAGCGSGRGEVSLEITYWPLELIKGHTSEPVGALLVTLIEASNMPIADIVLGTSDVYVKFSCANITKKSPVMYMECSPKWDDCKLEWFKIKRQSVLSVKVFDYDKFSKDDLLGSVKIPLDDIAHASMGDITKSWTIDPVPEYAVPDRTKPCTLTMRLQWVPFKNVTL